MGKEIGGSCCNSLDPSKMIHLLIEVLATSGLHRSALSGGIAFPGRLVVKFEPLPWHTL